ncbi:MAG TPA: hypothetical protein VLC09_20660 [Polyangiaceae bacterium]|nr:hypothetical protein [Polyangiaceae bacterium]
MTGGAYGAPGTGGFGSPPGAGGFGASPGSGGFGGPAGGASPYAAAPVPSAAGFAGAPRTGAQLSLEQLACVQAELDIDPSRAARVYAQNGIDAADHARQMQALTSTFAADPSASQRFDQLREYYRAILGPRG